MSESIKNPDETFDPEVNPQSTTPAPDATSADDTHADTPTQPDAPDDSPQASTQPDTTDDAVDVAPDTDNTSIEQLIAQAEQRGYLRGRNENIEALMHQSDTPARDEPQPSSEIMILNNLRPSVWQ